MNNHMNESMNNFLMKLNTHTHVYIYECTCIHTYIYIYVTYTYIYMNVCMCRFLVHLSHCKCVCWQCHYKHSSDAKIHIDLHCLGSAPQVGCSLEAKPLQPAPTNFCSNFCPVEFSNPASCILEVASQES